MWKRISTSRWDMWTFIFWSHWNIRFRRTTSLVHWRMCYLYWFNFLYLMSRWLLFKWSKYLFSLRIKLLDLYFFSSKLSKLPKHLSPWKQCLCTMCWSWVHFLFSFNILFWMLFRFRSRCWRMFILCGLLCIMF